MNLAPIIALAGGLAAAAVAAEVSPSTSAQAAGAGKELALEICSYCHVVAADQPVPPTLHQATPSFGEIANKPDVTRAALRRFIATTHWDQHTYPMTMPSPSLMDDEIDQIVSYMMSLRSGPPRPEPSESRAQRRLEAGEYIALELCSYCHVVSSDSRYRPDLAPPAPSFQAIADQPANTAGSLRRFVATTHWDDKTYPLTMPNQFLSAEETDEVVGYILSKRSPR